MLIEPLWTRLENPSFSFARQSSDGPVKMRDVFHGQGDAH